MMDFLEGAAAAVMLAALIGLCFAVFIAPTVLILVWALGK